MSLVGGKSDRIGQVFSFFLSFFLFPPIALKESNLQEFYGEIVSEAEKRYPSQVDQLRKISAQATEKISEIRRSIEPTIEQAKAQVEQQSSVWKTWPRYLFLSHNQSSMTDFHRPSDRWTWSLRRVVGR